MALPSVSRSLKLSAWLYVEPFASAPAPGTPAAVTAAPFAFTAVVGTAAAGLVARKYLVTLPPVVDDESAMVTAKTSPTWKWAELSGLVAVLAGVRAAGWTMSPFRVR